jgi:hypothetical protein
MRLLLITAALALAATSASAAECLTPREGSLLTRGLDGLVRSSGLNSDTEESFAIARKLRDLVQACILEQTKTHDADVVRKAMEPKK